MRSAGRRGKGFLPGKPDDGNSGFTVFLECIVNTLLVKKCDRRNSHQLFAIFRDVSDGRPSASRCAPALLGDFLEERMRALLREQEMRYRMIVRGLVAVQEGKSADRVEERMAAIREGGRL